MSMTHHNQTKKLTTWFLNLPLDESIDNKKYEARSSSPRPREAQLENQKAKKSSRRSSKRRKTAKDSKWQEKRQTIEKSKEKLKIKNSKLPLKSTPSNTLNASSPP
jgi:hypothetical protein